MITIGIVIDISTYLSHNTCEQNKTQQRGIAIEVVKWETTIVNVVVNLDKLKPLFFTCATTLWNKPNESNKTFT
jgi:hypothetical protein